MKSYFYFTIFNTKAREEQKAFLGSLYRNYYQFLLVDLSFINKKTASSNLFNTKVTHTYITY